MRDLYSYSVTVKNGHTTRLMYVVAPSKASAERQMKLMYPGWIVKRPVELEKLT